MASMAAGQAGPSVWEAQSVDRLYSLSESICRSYTTCAFVVSNALLVCKSGELAGLRVRNGARYTGAVAHAVSRTNTYFLAHSRSDASSISDWRCDAGSLTIGIGIRG
jgi:hypothetical protein